MNLDLRKWIVKCLVWSVALYASETWTISKTVMKRIEAFEMWIWRKMEKISWTAKVSNSEVLNWVKENSCIINTINHSRRQDDWEMYKREKEITVDEQHMQGIWNSKETSWRQMSVMCLSDGSQWSAKQQNTRRRRRNVLAWLSVWSEI